ncbi:MAG: DUF3426 domain-containing protein [Acidobacteriales bacterium]|nr:DUF3426 domain-containing protein [Terriglobales bacterium]
MAANTAVERRGPSKALLASIVILLAVGGGAFWYLERLAKQPPSTGPALTAEARDYVRYLKLSGVEMKATESYMKQTVVEITGLIANNGNRPVRTVELNCVFYDSYGQVVLRQRVAIVRPNIGLQPGENRNFRLPFDDLPESWNQGMPQLVIAHIKFD